MSEIFSFSKLVIDKIKKNDLKQIFEILMILPENRTIADLNTLTKIALNVNYFLFMFRSNRLKRSRTCQRFIIVASLCIWRSLRKRTLSSRKRMTPRRCISFSVAGWGCISGLMRSMRRNNLSSWIKGVVLANCSIGKSSSYPWYWKRRLLRFCPKGSLIKLMLWSTFKRISL